MPENTNAIAMANYIAVRSASFKDWVDLSGKNKTWIDINVVVIRRYSVARSIHVKPAITSTIERTISRSTGRKLTQGAGPSLLALYHRIYTQSRAWLADPYRISACVKLTGVASSLTATRWVGTGNGPSFLEDERDECRLLRDILRHLYESRNRRSSCILTGQRGKGASGLDVIAAKPYDCLPETCDCTCQRQLYEAHPTSDDFETESGMEIDAKSGCPQLTEVTEVSSNRRQATVHIATTPAIGDVLGLGARERICGYELYKDIVVGLSS
ncbi:hypothetical protein AMS68_003532 [Peltaster fructicola]|uniref:Uncharacterized protein n=1 Tax=Peltaster fructicola TaxID=286661 RepID=A0A6H0XTP8_9PEZI|nr:hypothetical protein AMS68_003532 [Peltaster fructicola]